MGLDIWFREDILHALRAAEQASATTAAAMESVVGDARYLRAYREGYRAALITVATAFGMTQSDEASIDSSVGEGELPTMGPAKSLKRRFSQSAL